MRLPNHRRIKAGSFANVIRDYQRSENFLRLGDETQKNYGRELSIMERPELLGAYPASAIRPSLVQSYLDGLSHLPGKQKIAKTALGAVQKWALVRDRLLFPITTGVEIVGSDGGHVPWTEEQVILAEQSVTPTMARVITLAANTGQRGSDIVRMRSSVSLS